MNGFQRRILCQESRLQGLRTNFCVGATYLGQLQQLFAVVELECLQLQHEIRLRWEVIVPEVRQLLTRIDLLLADWRHHLTCVIQRTMETNEERNQRQALIAAQRQLLRHHAMEMEESRELVHTSRTQVNNMTTQGILLIDEGIFVADDVARQHIDDLTSRLAGRVVDQRTLRQLEKFAAPLEIPEAPTRRNRVRLTATSALRYIRSMPFLSVAILSEHYHKHKPKGAPAGRMTLQGFKEFYNMELIICYRRGRLELVAPPAEFSSRSLDYFVALAEVADNPRLQEAITVTKRLAPATLVIDDLMSSITRIFNPVPTPAGLVVGPFEFARDDDRPGGVYAAIVCRRERLISGPSSGLLVVKLGHSYDVVLSRMKTLNSTSEYGDLGLVRLLWYIPVTGTDLLAKKRRLALEKRVREEFERLCLRIACNYEGKRKDELFEIMPCQIALAMHAYQLAYAKWMQYDIPNIAISEESEAEYSQTNDAASET